ncbi:MAG TPA: tripartite tricarboxylate transporter substrate binding protein [Xanthobacteraceae bacterium]|nr:tripartite tricarboxylate transporter substrate binding protein [Xanthobacteraceae bacterium]
MQAPLKLLALAVLTLAAAPVAPAQAQDYPTKPIRIISDSAPGSAVDVTFRMVMDRLGTALGQQIVPVDQPGASGAIAAHAAADAIPDGYTLFAPAISLFISLPGKAENLPLMLPRDFLPVASLIDQPMFICASSKSGLKTLPELIERAKKEPGKISFAATGIGRITHLTGLLLESRAGISLQVVPYTGGPAAALTDVIGGRVPLVIEGYSGLAGAIQAHTINVLAVGATHRLADFPDLPTVAETLPGFAAGGWQGIVAPLGTPAAAIQKFNGALNKVLGDRDLAKQLAVRGAYVSPMSPAESNAFVNAQQAQWRPVLEAFEASTKK